MNEPLKSLLKEHYDASSLDASQLASLRRLLAKRRPNRIVRLRSLSLAAIVALVSVTGIFVLLHDTPASLDGIALEISYNHNKNMQLEYTSTSISELKAKLDRLDFNLISSEQLAGPNWQLAGARYCSVHGKTAAQIRYINQTNSQAYTLYQAAYPENIGDLKNLQLIHKDGNVVRIWQEKGLLLGLVGPE